MIRRPARMPSALSALIFVALVALSAVAYSVVDSGIDRQERALLKQQTAQVVLVLETNLQHASLGLGSVGAEKENYVKGATQLQGLPTNSLLLVTKGHVNDAHGDVTPGPPQIRYAVGPDFTEGTLLTGELATLALAAKPTLSASPVIRLGGKPYVVYSIVPPSIGLPGYVSMETVQIAPKVPVPPPPGSTFRNLRIAMYATSDPRPDQLILSSTGRPLTGESSVQQMRLDNVSWAVVGQAQGSLLTGWSRATPWIVLSVGLLLAIGLAVTVETLVRRQNAQRDVAETLQAALLPATLPQVPGTEAAVRYLPGEQGLHVGGDWYDLIVLDDEHLLAVVGDVSGSGLRAAAVMARLLHAIQAYAADGDPPEAILAKLSGPFSREHPDQLATVLLILIDLDRHTITVVNGGHPPPLLLRGKQGTYVTTPVGLPVGVSHTGTYLPVTVPVAPASTLLAFTDGLVERRGESLDVGLERLRQAATADPDDSLEGLLSTVLRALVGRGATDDTVLLGFRWPAQPRVEPPAHPVTRGHAHGRV